MNIAGARMNWEWWSVNRWVVDGVSAGAIIGAIIGYLPALAALGGLIWYGVQIYESDTVQKYLDRRRTKSKLRRIERLVAEHKVLMAELDALATVRVARAIAADKVETAAAEARAQLAKDNNTRLVAESLKELVKSTPVD